MRFRSAPCSGRWGRLPELRLMNLHRSGARRRERRLPLAVCSRTEPMIPPREGDDVDRDSAAEAARVIEILESCLVPVAVIRTTLETMALFGGDAGLRQELATIIEEHRCLLSAAL